MVLTYQLVSMSTNLTRRGTTVYRRYAAITTNCPYNYAPKTNCVFSKTETPKYKSSNFMRKTVKDPN